MSERCSWCHEYPDEDNVCCLWASEMRLARRECEAEEREVADLRTRLAQVEGERDEARELARAYDSARGAVEAKRQAAEAKRRELEALLQDETNAAWNWRNRADSLHECLTAAEARAQRAEEAWREYLSAQTTIDQAGFMDNYTDAARARERQAKVLQLVRAALAETEVSNGE